MTLNIAYISDERFPSIHTDTQQVIKTIDALGNQGARISLIQPRMMRHLFTDKAARKKDICAYYNVHGRFSLDDILLWPASDFRVEKFFHGLAAPLKARLGRYDIVYTRNILPLLMAIQLRCPVIFETYRALPTMNPTAWKLVEKASRSPRFLGISTHSEYSRQSMIDAGIAPEAIRAVPNGFDPEEFTSPCSPLDARHQLGLDGNRTYAVYTGQIRMDKGMDVLLDMARHCPRVDFLIVGGPPADVEQLTTLADAHRITNVTITGQQPISKIPLYLQAADVLIIPPSAHPLKTATVLPMKTFTYMASGRPILAPDLPDTRGVLKKDANCIMVPADNAKEASRHLMNLVNDPSRAHALGLQAQKDALSFTWDARATHMMDFMNERLSIVSPPPH